MSAPQTICPRRLAANQANAQLSTGPKTSAGKAVSSLNAVKTGLTGRTVLLPSEDAVQYQAHVARFQKGLQPVGERETELVQSLADTQWRLNRIPGLEFGLFAIGRKRYADLFEEETDEQIRAALFGHAHSDDRSEALQKPAPAGEPLASSVPPGPARTPGTPSPT